MAVALGPRLGGGAAASVMLHGAIVAAFIVFRPTVPPPSPPIYRVQLIAAPAGDRAAGVVREAPQPTPPPTPAPTPATTRKTAPPRKVAPKTAAKAAPTPVVSTPTPTPPKPAAPQPKAADAPTAGGGPVGGNGADVANVNTGGIDFPYQPYINNIASQIIRRFHTSMRYTAEVRFIIHRDGSVDLDGISLVTPSPDYAFNQQAKGAVEAAAAANVFGHLPPGFREDVLPVTFRFSPTLIR